VRIILLGPPGRARAPRRPDRGGLRHPAHLDRRHPARQRARGHRARGRGQALHGRRRPGPRRGHHRHGRRPAREPDAAHGFLFDGFPRTVPQAEALEHLLIEHATAARRRCCGSRCPGRGRRAADRSADLLPVRAHLPRGVRPTAAEEGRCDDCGGELVQRDDDTEEVVLNRLDVYRRRPSRSSTSTGSAACCATSRPSGPRTRCSPRPVDPRHAAPEPSTPGGRSPRPPGSRARARWRWLPAYPGRPRAVTPSAARAGTVARAATRDEGSSR
jgi:adenylate kinase